MIVFQKTHLSHSMDPVALQKSVCSKLRPAFSERDSERRDLNRCDENTVDI